MPTGIKPFFSKLRTFRFFAGLFTAAYSIIFLPVCLESCGSTIKHQAVTQDSVTIIQLPEPSPISPALAKRLNYSCQRWFDSALKPKGFNGGIIVAKKGNIVFEKYNGAGHIGKSDIITDSTPFHIASVSKTFTAMAVLKLWQDGKIGLDDPFSKYFPLFDYPGVTIRTLLNHRSGLPNYLYFLERLGWDRKRFATNEDVLSILVSRKKDLKDIGVPGVHFAYCNTNYALLALLVEKISGKKFPAFLKETFFTPLQMQHTFLFDTSYIGKANPSYDWRGREIPLGFLDQVYGDKNIYTTARDLLTWDRALNSGLIFSPQTLAEAYTPYSNERPGIRNYGLGWRMNIYPTGKKTIYHNGWWHGNNASFIRLLQDSATIIVLGNKFTRSIYDAKELANLFGDYTAKGEEDEAEGEKLPDSIMPKKAASSSVDQPVLDYRDSLLKDVLKARKQ